MLKAVVGPTEVEIQYKTKNRSLPQSSDARATHPPVTLNQNFEVVCFFSSNFSTWCSPQFFAIILSRLSFVANCRVSSKTTGHCQKRLQTTLVAMDHLQSESELFELKPKKD